jgi:hypothetical protein
MKAHSRSTMKIPYKAFIEKKSHLKALILTTITLAGCINPWPHVVVDTDGLGQGKIAEMLRHSWMNSDQWLQLEVKQILKSENQMHSPRKSAEFAGMTCKDPPSEMCSYKGKIVSTTYGGGAQETSIARTVIEIKLPTFNRTEDVIVSRVVEN